jgi:dCTP deaminase
MTILSAQSIRKRLGMVTPFSERSTYRGMTFGLGPAGYDIRIDQRVCLDPGDFALASAMEKFYMPNDILARVADKSSWARQGLAVQNTVIEPGWRGFLTLELTNHGPDVLRIEPGTPIAQIIFERLDEPTELPYPEKGRYQDQEAGPQKAR